MVCTRPFGFYQRGTKVTVSIPGLHRVRWTQGVKGRKSENMTDYIYCQQSVNRTLDIHIQRGADAAKKKPLLPQNGGFIIR